MERKILEFLDNLPESERAERLKSYIATYIPEDQRKECQIRSVLTLCGYRL